MDVREKLVELIKDGIRKGLRAKGDDRLDYSFEDVADYLIANGVTVQECKLGAKKTNADRIRSMSDEELAEMLWKTGRNYRAVCADQVVDHDEQYAELVKWLQMPAEED